MKSEEIQAKRDVLKKLITMCQEMMVEGMGDSEKAGGDIKDTLKEELSEDDPNEGDPAEEAGESPEEEAGEMSLQDHIKSEMKKGKRSPLPQDRKVAIMVAGPRSMPSRSGKGRF